MTITELRTKLAAPLLFVLAIGVVTAPGAAQAAEFDPGAYVGFGWGQYRQDSDLGFIKTETDDIQKFIVGYQFNDYLSAEGGYVDFDHLRATLNLAGDVSTLDTDGFFARANLSYPLYRPSKQRDGKRYMVSLFGSAGAFYYDASEVVRSATGVVLSTANERETEPFYGLGVLFRGRSSAVRIEYEIFPDIGNVDFKVWSVSLFYYW